MTSPKTLKWDGSFLGDFSRKCIKSTIISKNGILLHLLQTHTFRVRCLLKAPKDTSVPCILDELKGCFGLDKLGTHRIKIRGRRYVMIRCTLTDIILTKFSQNKITPAFEEDMRNLIAFRYMLSIPFTQNGSFLIRMRHQSFGKLVPYSFYEPQTFVCEHTIDPSERFMKRWFGEKDVGAYITNILPKRIEEEWTSFLCRLRTDIETVIETVDADYVWIGVYIIEKITKLCNHPEK